MKKLMSAAALFGAMMFGTPDTALGQQLLLQPANGKDAQLVDSDFGSDVNFGGHWNLIDNWGGYPRAVGLLEFNLGALPAGAVVSSAVLSLYHASNIATGATYDIFRVTSAWDEATVTFNTAPTYDPLAVATLTLDNASFCSGRSKRMRAQRASKSSPDCSKHR